MIHFTAVESIQIGVAALIAMRLPQAFRDRRQLVVLRGVRLRHLALGARSLATVIVIAALLLAPDTPLRLGWWHLIGGSGSLLVGASPDAGGISGTAQFLMVACVSLLLLQLPRLALAEEREFRRGAEKRSRVTNAVWAMKFGLVHLLIGIPIGAAVALGAAGALFGIAYTKGLRVTGNRGGAILEAARVHLMHNVIALTIALMGVFAAH